jgi:hypothetical protein
MRGRPSILRRGEVAFVIEDPVKLIYLILQVEDRN